MKKRLSVGLLTIVLLFVFCGNSVFACDEFQTNTYVPQILFGDKASAKSSNEKVEMLMAALYLCSEQADGLGQEKIDYLKSKKVSGVPKLSDIDIKSNILIECSHNTWESKFDPAKKKQTNRRKLLQNTVNKVFDFGFVNNLFGSRKGKCNSFAALLYYSHILADYLADDPTETSTNVNGRLTPSYAGDAYTIINGDKPEFSLKDRTSNESFILYSRPLDHQNRAGVAFGNIGPDLLEKVGERGDISYIRPSGWNYNTFKENDNTPSYIYNRCHLIAHQLGGDDEEYNLVTGTDYMNKTGMKELEDKVAEYIRTTKYHVLYRVTPIYKGENKVCSGVQMEAYSVEDDGKGICFNRFCYNVQPGIRINYLTGDNYFGDTIVDADNKLPFALYGANDNKPDLILEMNKHLAILFEDQKNTGTYLSMMSEINAIASEARAVEGQDNSAKEYIQLKQLEYRYLDVLKRYVPRMLEKEEFFQSAFI